MPTQDGYPTESELQRIVDWPDSDPHGWLDFIKACWWASDWGWTEEKSENLFGRPCRKCSISTGGWSGNEEIIEAMRKSSDGWLWSRTWYSSRRGGHYVFEVSIDQPGPHAG